jgi:hypothetical protein
MDEGRHSDIALSFSSNSSCPLRSMSVKQVISEALEFTYPYHYVTDWSLGSGVGLHVTSHQYAHV